MDKKLLEDFLKKEKAARAKPMEYFYGKTQKRLCSSSRNQNENSQSATGDNSKNDPAPDFPPIQEDLPPVPDFTPVQEDLPPVPDFTPVQEDLPPVPDFTPVQEDLPPEQEAAHLTECSIQLNDSHSYAHLLQQNKGIMWTSWVVAIADRVRTTRKLSKCSYQAIIRLQNTLYCSCVAPSLEIAMTCQANGVRLPSPSTCIHLEVLNLFDNSTDVVQEWVPPEERPFEHNYSTFVDQNQVIEIFEGVYLVYHDRGFATVSNGKCNCTHHKGPCPFTRLVAGASDVEENMLLTVRSRQTALSTKPISFMEKRSDDKGCWHAPPSLKPTECSKCGCTDLELASNSSELLLHMVKKVTIVKVYVAHCNKCDVIVCADGGDEKILNMGNFLVSHHLLHQYCKLFVTEGLPLYSYYKMCVWDWSLANVDNMLSYAMLRISWLAYVDLIDYGSPQQDAFQCHICKESPDTIICDGITLSLQRRFLKGHRNDEQYALLDGLSFQRRIVVDNSAVRKLLAEGKLSPALRDAATVHCSWLLPALNYLGNKSEVPVCWAKLLKDLSASSPACALFDSANLQLIETLNSLIYSGFSAPEHLELLSRACPVLYDILRHDIGQDVLSALEPIFKHVWSRTLIALTFPSHKRVCLLQNDEDSSSFPMLPQKYQRGTFRMDKSSLKSKVCAPRNQKTKSLTPGIFTVNCAHGICYGFQLMQKYESPDTPFTVIRTRFEKAPSLIIYDNSCNLHEYCLNRDPGFFHRTKFVIDRFHWYNHRGGRTE